jgi:hypothetical protein
VQGATGPRQRLGQRTGRPEQIALAERRAERAGARELLLRVDPLGQHGRAPPLRLGADRGHDPGAVLGRALREQPQVELDHVGVEHRHQRERARVRADIVERDAPARRAQPRERVQHRLGARDQRLFRELDEQREAGRRALGRDAVERRGVGVEEERERRVEPRPLRGRERRVARREVERQNAVLPPRRREQLLRRVQPAAGAAGAHQRLVADDSALAKLDDRLENRAQIQLVDGSKSHVRVPHGSAFNRSERRRASGPPRA